MRLSVLPSRTIGTRGVSLSAMLALLFAPFVVGVPSMPRRTASIATPRTGTAFLVDGSRDWLRAYDWTTTSLGGPETWSSSLRLLADLVLQSGHPMALLWGSEHILLYNDAFSAIVGPDDHPRAFGRAVQEALPDLWERIAPSLDLGLAGPAAPPGGERHVLIDPTGSGEGPYFDLL